MIYMCEGRRDVLRWGLQGGRGWGSNRMRYVSVAIKGEDKGAKGNNHYMVRLRDCLVSQAG